MAKNFRAVKQYLESQNADLLIDGMHHSPGPMRELFASVAGMIWTAGLVSMFFGTTIFSTLGMAQPAWFKYVKENQMVFALGLFMLNNIAQGMMATGAFEIYVDGDLVHSRLETGGFPSQEKLDQILNDISEK